MTTRAEFHCSWVYTFSATSQILADLSTCSTERPVATQHFLRNCVDRLAALSHIGYTIRSNFGLLCTLTTSQGATTREPSVFFGALAFSQLLWFLSRL